MFAADISKHCMGCYCLYNKYHSVPIGFNEVPHFCDDFVHERQIRLTMSCELEASNHRDKPECEISDQTAFAVKFVR